MITLIRRVIPRWLGLTLLSIAGVITVILWVTP